jgi:hypothetical protein
MEDNQMSEHQVVAFRAIDGPVSKKNLAYMHTQSSRAEIDEWSFENEYHYGDFRGNAIEMMRRGYDFHLHYANFGIRKLCIRLPAGLPVGETWQYFEGDSLQFHKDKGQPSGTICVDPGHEPGFLDDIWNLDEVFEELLPIRAELLEGDLRPLYLAHLAMQRDMNHDPESQEGPVPAGLQKLTKAQKALADFYGLSDSLIAAAALRSPGLEARRTPQSGFGEWLQRQPQKIKDEWLLELMNDAEASPRAAMIAEFRKSQKTPEWPTAPGGRTMAELDQAAEQIEEKRRQKGTKKKTKGSRA